MNMQAKVFVRVQAKEISIKRMECEKPESFDNDCQLDGCKICLIDHEVNLLNDMTNAIRMKGREFDDLDLALSQLETCCNEGRREPLALISSEGLVRSVTILAMELLR